MVLLICVCKLNDTDCLFRPAPTWDVISWDPYPCVCRLRYCFMMQTILHAVCVPYAEQPTTGLLGAMFGG